MPTIRVRCPSCGQHFELLRGQCALLGDENGDPVAYAFRCRICAEPVVRWADLPEVAMLLAGGASERGVEERAGRPPHPERPRPGPPFTADDLLEFHLLLEDEGWFAQLTALAAAGGPDTAASPHSAEKHTPPPRT